MLSPLLFLVESSSPQASITRTADPRHCAKWNTVIERTNNRILKPTHTHTRAKNMGRQNMKLKHPDQELPKPETVACVGKTRFNQCKPASRRNCHTTCVHNPESLPKQNGQNVCMLKRISQTTHVPLRNTNKHKWTHKSTTPTSTQTWPSEKKRFEKKEKWIPKLIPNLGLMPKRDSGWTWLNASRQLKPICWNRDHQPWIENLRFLTKTNSQMLPAGYLRSTFVDGDSGNIVCSLIIPWTNITITW